MRSLQEREQVKGMVEAGLNDCAISRATGIPRSTVREWRSIAFRPPLSGSRCVRCAGDCHDFARLDGPAYTYLLGAYLGDGHVARGAREVFNLRIYLDSRYPQIILEVAEAMEALLPGKTAHRALHATAAMVRVDMWSKHWPCLFPQHGPGMKHTRPIRLADWQQRIVDDHHEEFLRGLIHSDGCRHINRVWRNGRAYEYSRYHFTNVSDDIRGLFCASCDALGIAWRRMNARNISVARREAVAALDEFVGPKR
jgi:hypothetical protein